MTKSTYNQICEEVHIGNFEVSFRFLLNSIFIWFTEKAFLEISINFESFQITKLYKQTIASQLKSILNYQAFKTFHNKFTQISSKGFVFYSLCAIYSVLKRAIVLNQHYKCLHIPMEYAKKSLHRKRSFDFKLRNELNVIRYNQLSYELQWSVHQVICHRFWNVLASQYLRHLKNTIDIQRN